MAQNFIGCDRDQVLLLPPDLRDWLPADHLARFVIETVEQLDLSGIYGYYRRDGLGRPAHDPGMMVALLLYAYATGVTSSRQVERRCVDDVAFRVICCDRQPDHSTIARFLVRHQDALAGLFCQVLGLCRRAGMVRVGTVAVDSTKLAANASAGQNRTLEGLEAEASRIVSEALETDRREDQLYGDKRGDELPDDLADPGTRKARIKELLEAARAEQAEAEARRAEKVAEHERYRAQTGKRKRGRQPNPEGGRRERAVKAKKYNMTDPDSGVVRHRGMLFQGYNVQVAASEDQLILATSVSGISPDGGRMEPMVQAAEQAVAKLGGGGRIEQVLADNSYWNTGQINRLSARGLRVLIPPANRRAHKPSSEVARMRAELDTEDGARQYRRRQQIIEPVFARTKHHRGITRVWRRGKAAVEAEISLIATTHNLLKLRTALQAG